MTAQPDHDIASLFDPNFDEPTPAIVPPGALPPSWAAAMAANRTSPTLPASTSRSAPELAWSQVPDGSMSAPAAVSAPAVAIETEAGEPDGKRTRGRTKRRTVTDTDAQFARQTKDAATRADRARKAVRLHLVGVEGNITRTRTHSTAWFVQGPGPWNMRPVARQRRYIQNEALVLANLADAGVTGLHRRLVRTPWPVRQWAQSHDGWAEPIPDVAGALSWADYLRGQQHAMLWGNPTQKGRYWGIELPPRSALAIGLDTASEWALPLVDVPVMGRVATMVRRWARTAFLNEQKALAEHLTAIERILSGQGVAAKPATATQMDYLLLRSTSLGLPLDAEGVISGGGDWESSDVAALEDLTDLELTPGDGYTTVRGQVGGRDYTGYAIVLTVGRMAPLPIPERMLPWQVIGDQSGEPLEWSERIRLKTKSQSVHKLRRLTSSIEAQFDHYTVEHDQVPPQELAEQHALAQRVISDIEEDHSGLSVRTEGWYRVLVVGTTPDEAKEKVSMLQEMYAPHIRLEQEHGQYQLLREFMLNRPGSSGDFVQATSGTEVAMGHCSR